MTVQRRLTNEDLDRMEQELTQRDDTWSAFRGVDSLKPFKEFIAKIRFHDKVPDAVVQTFSLVRELILHSYLSYKILDVAFEKALMGFELALHTRYCQLEGGDVHKRSNKTLKQRIDWASAEGFFTGYEGLAERIRYLRNDAAHPKCHKMRGFSVANFIICIIDVINQLFEDADTLAERVGGIRSLIKFFDEEAKKGCVLSCEGGEQIIYCAELLLANERVTSPLFYVMFQPIFDPRMKDNIIETKEPISCCATSWEFDTQGISFVSMDGSGFRLEKLPKDQRGVFDEWEERLSEGEGGLVQMVVLDNFAEARMNLYYNQLHATIP